MTEYVYKGFKVYYEVALVEESNSYGACGHVVSFLDKDGLCLTEKFQTVSTKKDEAQREIKKLIEDYIDFEYEQFLKIDNEHS